MGNIYAPDIRQLLVAVGSSWLRLILDESGHTDRFRILILSAWYRGWAM